MNNAVPASRNIVAKYPQSPWITSFLAVILACGAIATHPVDLRAQDSQTQPADQAVQGQLPPELEGITGLRPDMSEKELLDAGIAAVMADRLDEGRRILLVVVERDRTNLKAISNLGFAYERLAEEAKAVGTEPDQAQKANHFIDQAVDIYLEAAALALAGEEPAVSEQMYNRVLMYRPAQAKAVLGLARVFNASGRSIQAIGRYKDYLKTPAGRKNARAYLEMGLLYLDEGFWRKSLESFQRGKELDPDDPDLDLALARAYRKGERMDEALAAAQDATRKSPREPKYRDALAELQLVQGNAEQATIESRRAIEYAREQLQERTTDSGLLDQLSGYYITYENALTALLAEGKANPVVRVDLARAIQEHAVVGRTLALARALKVLDKAEGVDRDNPQLLEELAVIQKGLSLDKDAVKTCRRLLALDPANATAKRILSEVKPAANR